MNVCFIKRCNCYIVKLRITKDTSVIIVVDDMVCAKNVIGQLENFTSKFIENNLIKRK